ncbi:MAG TPA: hypothetical protein PKE04_04130, partial [Clostridia bacterium]|nr:hypothetical protein [Clostridia bacterium]
EESLPQTLLGRFVFRADTKEAFAESIQTLMERPPKRHIEAVFALYQRFYSRDAAVCGFAKILGLPVPS